MRIENKYQAWPVAILLFLVVLWLGPDSGRQMVRDELAAGWKAMKATALHIQHSVEDAFQPSAAVSKTDQPKAARR